MSATTCSDDDAYQQWLQGFIASHAAVRECSAVAQFLERFLNQLHAFHQAHGNPILYCRGQQRMLVSPNEKPSSSSCSPSSSSTLYARWFDFVQLAKSSRACGPERSSDGKRRFETFSLKVQAARDKSKFGMTDDTGYLFPCLQHFLPRACFIVMDHERGNVFLLHGNKKFAGQGDDAPEEEGTSNSATNSGTNLHNPPAKCFPGTEDLKPTHYIFTWKANGKNSGIYGYKDPVDSQIWLFVNSKGVCECAGLLEDVVKDEVKKGRANFSEIVQNEPQSACLLPKIFEAFCDIWNYPYPSLNHKRILDLWSSGYLLLFEFCDNKHIVLERGEGGRHTDHLAFIGLVRQPALGSVDTYNTGLVFKVDNFFTFDLWKQEVHAPICSCKPSVLVRAEHFSQATKELMQGTFFRDRPSGSEEKESSWYDPNQNADSGSILTGEGAVCYEMAQDNQGANVIRQLLKAKTSSYITHRQVRGFFSSLKADEVLSFESLHMRVKKFCRRKFGDLTPQPYPDLKTFCQDPPSIIVEAASLYYTMFGMWLFEMAGNLQTTVANLIGLTNADILVPLQSDTGQEIQRLSKLLGLPTEEPDKAHVALRCGMAFRIAEFSAIYSLDHSKVFAAPHKILEELTTSPKLFWAKMPTGYNGFIHVGFRHAFPEGITPNSAMDEESRKRKKRDKSAKKKQKGNSVLEPFQRAFRSFLLANPDVKLRIGSRKENPKLFTFISHPEKYTLLSCPDIDGFRERLSKLPRLDPQAGSVEEEMKPARILDQEEAVAQAMRILQPEFPAVQDLFRDPVDLTFGDVSGRLVPIIKSMEDESYMLIIRGFPGLGKSTIAKAFQHIYGIDCVAVVEADSFFGPKCPYDPELLAAAHEDAQGRAQEALESPNTRLVIVSNTSTTAREYGTYIRIAQACKRRSAAAILTLDTKAPLEEIDNIHSVPQEKVQQMAFRLRHADNNPEGKTVEQILEIADAQTLNYRTVPAPVLVWALLGSEGQLIVNEIWDAFTNYARDNNVLLPSNIVRPSNLHVTQLYLRPSSPEEVLARLSSLWGYHGKPQTITIGEVRYSVVFPNGTDGGDNPSTPGQRTLVNLAVQVTSLSPQIADSTTPHVTIAYNPDHASAADSNKLWQDCESSWDGGQVLVFDYQPSQNEFGSVIEAGLYQTEKIMHRLPDWAKINSG
jgi:hypothetical protein